MLSAIFLGGYTLMNGLGICRVCKSVYYREPPWYIWLVVLIMISGSGWINIGLLNVKIPMKESYKPWLVYHHIKLLLSKHILKLAILFLSPLSNLVFEQFSKSNALVWLQMFLLIMFLLISPFMRYYRELHVDLHRRASHVNLSKILKSSLNDVQEFQAYVDDHEKLWIYQNVILFTTHGAAVLLNCIIIVTFLLSLRLEDTIFSPSQIQRLVRRQRRFCCLRTSPWSFSTKHYNQDLYSFKGILLVCWVFLIDLHYQIIYSSISFAVDFCCLLIDLNPIGNGISAGA